MTNVLFINACIRDNSRTLDLARCVLDRIEDGEVHEVNLGGENLSPIGLAELEVRDKAHRSGDYSDSTFDLAKQFALADTIVVATPYWDLTFPSILKIYLERITVNGLTFTYSKEGRPVGLCKAQKLVYVTTAGGPIKCNFGYEYVSALAKNFYGIADVEFVSAEGLDVYGADVDKILHDAKSSLTDKI